MTDSLTTQRKKELIQDTKYLIKILLIDSIEGGHNSDMSVFSEIMGNLVRMESEYKLSSSNRR